MRGNGTDRLRWVMSQTTPKATIDAPTAEPVANSRTGTCAHPVAVATELRVWELAAAR